MRYEKNGFTFERMPRGNWKVTFGNMHFAYVSTKAVIRALRSN